VSRHWVPGVAAALAILILALGCSARLEGKGAPGAQSAWPTGPPAGNDALQPSAGGRLPLVLVSGEAAETRPGVYTTSSPGLRASFGDRPSEDAEIRFVYHGPSPTLQPLASGELRRQIGLRLRAQDTCNLVYVMWHIEPAPKIEVSVKTNPGQSTHAQCRDHGYTFVSPTWSDGGQAIRAGDPHSLRAAIRGQELRISIDGRACWTGILPASALALAGPAGIRSDNASFAFTFVVY
jgi:hypothetical protein